jgi:hypothetical protein
LPTPRRDGLPLPRKLYAECFGWTFQDVPGIAYHLYSTGEGGVGGGLMKAEGGFPDHMVNYVYVDGRLLRWSGTADAGKNEPDRVIAGNPIGGAP